MTISTEVSYALHPDIFARVRHLALLESGLDLDGVTIHALIRPIKNDSLALIEAIFLLSESQLKLTGIHYLHGTLTGVIELDIQPGHIKTPVSWRVYIVEASTL